MSSEYQTGNSALCDRSKFIPSASLNPLVMEILSNSNQYLWSELNVQTCRFMSSEIDFRSWWSWSEQMQSPWNDLQSRFALNYSALIHTNVLLTGRLEAGFRDSGEFKVSQLSLLWQSWMPFWFLKMMMDELQCTENNFYIVSEEVVKLVVILGPKYCIMMRFKRSVHCLLHLWPRSIWNICPTNYVPRHIEIKRNAFVFWSFLNLIVLNFLHNFRSFCGDDCKKKVF